VDREEQAAAVQVAAVQAHQPQFQAVTEVMEEAAVQVVLTAQEIPKAATAAHTAAAVAAGQASLITRDFPAVQAETEAQQAARAVQVLAAAVAVAIAATEAMEHLQQAVMAVTVKTRKAWGWSLKEKEQRVPVGLEGQVVCLAAVVAEATAATAATAA
jgi:cytochrome P450